MALFCRVEESCFPLAGAELVMQFDFGFSVGSHVALRKNVSTI
jgi:hypothetical protein